MVRLATLTGSDARDSNGGLKTKAWVFQYIFRGNRMLYQIRFATYFRGSLYHVRLRKLICQEI